MKHDLTTRLRSPRFILGIALLASLIWVGLKPLYARFLFVDRAPWASFFETFPDRKTPSYVNLLRVATEVIPSGEAVAVAYPTLEWHGGYSYAYFRAQYFLPRNRVIPLGWPSGPRPEKLADANWAIVYGSSSLPGDWTVVTEVEDGRVMRRIR